MKRRAALAVALAVTWLASGCASVAPLGPAAAGESLSGRLVIKVDALGSEPARAFSSTFDLRGDPQNGALGLSTPLGSMLAQARWAPGEVVLMTPQGTRRFADLDGLTRDVLGESVPVEAWFDWLRGRPWPAAPSTVVAGDSGFEQLGWSVDLARFAQGAVSATRQLQPTVTVRIQLDRS
ncbi:MAG: lipoprotein insertase outer membrane protein LolB [Caldimonas sp.]